MDTTKELLLFVATTFTTFGAILITTKLWEGVTLLLLGAVTFVGRGFYKKYFNE
jgi:hypothetical protein